MDKVLGDSGNPLHPHKERRDLATGSLSVDARQDPTCAARISGGVADLQDHDEGAVQKVPEDAPVDHGASDAQPDGDSPGRNGCDQPDEVIPMKAVSMQITSPSAVQGDSIDASAPGAHDQPTSTSLSAADRAEEVRLGAHRDSSEGVLETPKAKEHATDKSSVTTPGDDSTRTLSFVKKGSKYGIVRPPRIRPAAAPKPPVPEKGKGKAKKGKVKEPLLLPPDYVRYLQKQYDSGEMRRRSARFFEGKTVFLINSDLEFATDETRRKLKFVCIHLLVRLSATELRGVTAVQLWRDGPTRLRQRQSNTHHCRYREAARPGAVQGEEFERDSPGYSDPRLVLGLQPDHLIDWQIRALARPCHIPGTCPFRP